MTKSEHVDRVANWLRLFINDGQVTELRALNAGSPGRTVGGHFLGSAEGLAAMARHAIDLGTAASGVYFVPNPIDPAKISKRLSTSLGKLLAGTVRDMKPGDGTSDEDILDRRWLLVDVDPAKPTADVSATEEERLAAWGVLANVRDALGRAGFAGEIVGDSGNGWHVCYPIALPNDDAARETVRGVLKGLAAMYDRPGLATVDAKTFNAARIWKLYGTPARKGSNTAERPHRLSRIVEVKSPAA